MSGISDIMSSCRICPRECGSDRNAGVGACGAGRFPEVARIGLHHWEEPCISGTGGSGTVFLSHCNLSCVFCQNHEISQGMGVIGTRMTEGEIAKGFLKLQDLGAHNINLVTANHYTPQAAEAIRIAKSEGLTIPVVWNSNGYESVVTLESLEGLVDIYLPDLKYSDDTLALRYSGAGGYWNTARKAIREMLRQVGPVVFDDGGMAVRGLMVRHLVLPGNPDNTKDVLDWIRTSLPRGVYASIMSQYFPTHLACGYPELARRLTRDEYAGILDYLGIIGMTDGWIQDPDSASEDYVPPFDLSGDQ